MIPLPQFLRRFLGRFASGGGGGAPEPGPGPPVDHELDRLAELLTLHNAQRMARRLPLLARDATLDLAANHQALVIAARTQLSHSAPPVAMIWGENVAKEPSGTAAAVMGEWLASPGHRANIISPSYHSVGLAAQRGPDGNWYWCVQFGG